MGTGIQAPPNEYDFGYEFDYALWPKNTQVDLVNIPWNNDYRDVVRFENRSKLNEYIDSLAPAGIRVNQMSYVKPNEPVRVNIPHSRANRFNYLRARNPLQPIDGDMQKDYYYFILDVRYVAPNTSELILQLDVWQTYIYDVTFGNCYVERGHIGIANHKSFQNYGRDYLTVPEGIDVGSDYRVITKRTDEIIGTNAAMQSAVDVLVFSTTDLTATPVPDAPLAVKTSPASFVNGLPSGAGAYLFSDVSEFSSWMDGMRDYPWITQGIVSITAVPKVSRYAPEYVYDTAPNHTNLTIAPLKKRHFPNWRNSEEIRQWIPERYRHLGKFWTFPYMVIEMTTWSATPVILRPEIWADPDAFVMERATYMPPNQRVQFTPRRYNSSGQGIEAAYGMTIEQLNEIAQALPEDMRPAFIAKWSELGDDYGDYLDVMTQVANFPAMPLVNNGAINFLASNQNTIAYQRTSADWTQDRAMGLAKGQYDVAGGAIRTQQDMTAIGVNADRAQTGITNRTAAAQAVLGGIGDVASGAAGGVAFGVGGIIGGTAAGAAKAVMGGISTGIQIGANDEALAVRNSTAVAMNREQAGQAGLARDTNKSLADWAARGDYANMIAGVNAKVQDAQMIQPSMSGQFGGDASNLAFGTMELSIRWKLIDNAAMRIIGEYWLRYGYSIRAFIRLPKSLMVMSKFTYWKLTESYITSATVPEVFKQTIRGITEKGFTAWANPNDIGQIDFADNQILPGIEY